MDNIEASHELCDLLGEPRQPVAVHGWFKQLVEMLERHGFKRHRTQWKGKFMVVRIERGGLITRAKAEFKWNGNRVWVDAAVALIKMQLSTIASSRSATAAEAEDTPSSAG